MVTGKKEREPWTPPDLATARVYRQLQRLFERWHAKQPHREGIHVSGLIKTDKSYCARQQVLMHFFPHAKLPLWEGTLRIFRHGWAVHEKWQQLFALVGAAEEIETTHIHPKWLIRFTPDVLAINLGGMRCIVEIKGINHDAYESMQSVHKDGAMQAYMYMYLLEVPYAVVLVENKNNQDFKVWVLKRDDSKIEKYLNRLRVLRAYIRIYNGDGSLPRRHVMCPVRDTPTAKACPVREYCFMNREERANAFPKTA